MPDGESALASKFEVLARVLDERTWRLVAAAEAEAMGFGGVTAVARASGLSRGTVIRGMAELKVAPEPARGQRIRRRGAGRKRTIDRDATLKRDLESLVEPVTRGDPESPLRWTCKSLRQLAAELNRLKHRTSHRMVAELLHEMNYSLQANRKSVGGFFAPGPGRAISPYQRPKPGVPGGPSACRLRGYEEEGTGGRLQKQWKRTASERRSGKGSLSPISSSPNLGVRPRMGFTMWRGTRGGSAWEWITIRRHSPPRAFAGGGKSMGAQAYPDARKLLITADSGGSNARIRLWKVELQKLADETGTGDLGLPFAAGNQQVEQDRTSAVLLHQPKLARQASGEPPGDRQSHRGDNDEDRVTSPCGNRSRQIPEGDQDAPINRSPRSGCNVARLSGEWNYTILPRPV